LPAHCCNVREGGHKDLPENDKGRPTQGEEIHKETVDLQQGKERKRSAKNYLRGLEEETEDEEKNSPEGGETE